MPGVRITSLRPKGQTRSPRSGPLLFRGPFSAPGEAGSAHALGWGAERRQRRRKGGPPGAAVGKRARQRPASRAPQPGGETEDAGCSNHLTPTKALWNRWFQRAFLVPRNGWDCLCPPQARAGTPSTEGAMPRDKPAQQYLKRRPRVRAAFQNPDRSTPRRTRAMPARIQGRKIIGNRRIALWFS